jgi:putative acetyltransferase
LIVRRESETDRAAIRAVHAAAFEAEELEGSEPVEVRLVDDLRAEGHVVPGLSLVAVADDAIVGHVVCSRARVGDGDWNVLGLGPIGVLPAEQGRGVGTALMHAVVAAADALDWPAIVLLGEPAYYGRFGFEPASAHGVLAPVPAWEPFFQIRRLAAWTPSLTGAFRYAPPFEHA